MIRFLGVLALLLGGCITPESPGGAPDAPPLHESPDRFEVGKPEAVAIRMRDGIDLAGTLWRPVGVDRSAVYLTVTYYGNQYIGLRALGDASPLPASGERAIIVGRGYAYLEVNARGTQLSGGCFDWGGKLEQSDAAEIIEYAATASWSNGLVAQGGNSYAGWTTWEGAATGHTALKLIIPTESTPNMAPAIIRNGTPQDRANSEHQQMIAIASGPGRTSQTACPDDANSVALARASLDGDIEAPEVREYFDARNITDEILQRYHGSAFIVHSYDDRNVRMGVMYPFANELAAAGARVRTLVGNTDHNGIPTNNDCPQENFWELAADIMDAELLGKPDLRRERSFTCVRDHGWSNTTDIWPPAQEWTTLYVGAGTLEEDVTAEGRQMLANPLMAGEIAHDAGAAPLPSEFIAIGTPLQTDLRISGQPQLHVTLAPRTAEGARVYAELLAREPSGETTLITWATLDLRYHAGGTKRQTLSPDTPVLARIEMEPVDQLLPEGTTLSVRVTPGATFGRTETTDPTKWDPMTGRFHQDDPRGAAVDILWGGKSSTIRLPSAELP